MAKLPSMDQWIEAVNNQIKKDVEKNPEKVTFVCSECGKKYIAKSFADTYVCPICGALQDD